MLGPLPGPDDDDSKPPCSPSPVPPAGAIPSQLQAVGHFQDFTEDMLGAGSDPGQERLAGGFPFSQQSSQWQTGWFCSLELLSLYLQVLGPRAACP